MGKGISKILDYLVNCFLSILFPKSEECVICKDYIEGNYLCLKCNKKINMNFYLKYSMEKIKDLNIYSIGYYNGILKEVILKLKYSSDFECADIIANLMKEIIEAENLNFDYIAFVPSEKKKLKSRGFNQTKVIATKLARLVNAEVLDLFKKDNSVKDQIGLNIKERWENLLDVFHLKLKCENKNILLIDDVYTSGATVFYCSKLLIELNNKVIVLTAAKSKI